MPTAAGKRTSLQIVHNRELWKPNAMPGSHFQNKSGVHVQPSSRASWTEALVQSLARELPIVRPLSHYAHDHPLRPLYHLNFVDSLKRISSVFGVDALLSPVEYAEYCHAGRIDQEQLARIIDDRLRCDCRDELLDADPLAILHLGSRQILRMATILVPELDCQLDADVWVENLIDDARQGTATEYSVINTFQQWLNDRKTRKTKSDEELLQYLERDTIGRPLAKWSSHQWCIAHDHAVWWYCRQGSQAWQPPFENSGRIRQTFSRLQPVIDDEIRRALVPFLSAYVDPGIAAWQLPNRDADIFKAFAQWLASSPSLAFRSSRSKQLLTEMVSSHALLDPHLSIESTLRALQINQADAIAYIHDLVGVVRAWSGLLYHLSISEYPCHESIRRFSLTQWIAMLLLLDRWAISQETGHMERMSVPEWSRTLQRQNYEQQRGQSLATRQTWLFRLASSLNWSPAQLSALRVVDWSTIHHELNCFSKFERQWVAQQAFEQNYRQRMRASLSHIGLSGKDEYRTPAFMLITCAEPSEESIRRHVERICPAVETVGVAGFFNLDIKFKDCQSSHYVPHVPHNVRARHVVSEVEMEPPYKSSTLEVEQVSDAAAQFHASESLTDASESGFTLAEMAVVVSRLLVEAGVALRLPRIVLLMGHETSSVNNFYETADNCTFCSKQDVRINTRAFVQMANDHRVREAMRLDGVHIPETTLFVAAVHHTCSDKIVYLDMDTVSPVYAQELSAIVAILDQAASNNALERLQALVPGPLSQPRHAIRLSEDRQHSGAYARPEYSLMGHALCIVGRRQWTRGLVLDRRAFLFSYDPLQDDEDLTVLARLLAVNLPVLANICFDYWFSRVAPERFGSGRKAELKLIAHMGVTDTEYGDLRVGLPFEMVDQHEPMRLQVFVDARPDLVERMLEANPRVSRFFTRGYMQLNVLGKL